MHDGTGDNEVIVNVGNAELIVPADAVSVEHKSPLDTKTVIDAAEFFRFLEAFDNWPTNGLQMAEAAKRQSYSSNLVQFLEGLPGSFATVANIMPYAEDPSKPPYGKAIVADPISRRAGAEDFGDLSISDVTQGKPS